MVESARGLSEAYRKGESSSHVSLAAYVATRVPATFAANQTVQKQLAAAMPTFAPESVLDIGAGPGVASWAALAEWPTLSAITQCEQDKNFAGLAATLNAASAVPSLSAAKIVLKSEATLPLETTADLVVASYMLAELPLNSMPQLAQRLWTRTQQVLVLVEPGTPQGFARLRAARTTLVEMGAHVLAPCTHQNVCPMAVNDWCHFKTRVQRSREHMHAKAGRVPFEDEAFAYLILSRQAAAPVAAPAAARIIAPPTTLKSGMTFKLCDAAGLRNEVIASREKATYKRARKKTWGDVWE